MNLAPVSPTLKISPNQGWSIAAFRIVCKDEIQCLPWVYTITFTGLFFDMSSQSFFSWQWVQWEYSAYLSIRSDSKTEGDWPIAQEPRFHEHRKRKKSVNQSKARCGRQRYAAPPRGNASPHLIGDVSCPWLANPKRLERSNDLSCIQRDFTSEKANAFAPTLTPNLEYRKYPQTVDHPLRASEGFLPREA